MMMKIARRLGPLLPFLGFLFFSLVFLTSSRLALAWLNWDRVGESQTLLTVLALGLRMDTILLAMVLVLPVTVTLLLPGSIIDSRVYRAAISLFLSVWGMLFALMEFATPVYADFFDSRPGRIFFEYLSYPREIGLMLVNGFLIESVLVIAGTLFILVVVYLGLAKLQQL